MSWNNGQWRKKVRIWFNIHTKTTKKINRVLKIKIKFMLLETAQPLMKLCHLPNFFAVVTVKITSRGASNKFEGNANKIPNFQHSKWQDLVCSIQWLHMKRKCFWESTIKISCNMFFVVFFWQDKMNSSLLKTLLVFYNVMIEVTLSLAQRNSSLQRYLILRQLLPSMHYTEWIVVFGKRSN